MQDVLFPVREFRAISLWQPHAQAVALGIKPYETRHWSTKYRGPLVIHAAQRPFRRSQDPYYWNLVCFRLSEVGFAEPGLVYGAAVALVDLVDCVPTESLGDLGPEGFWGDFSEGRFAWKLENVRRIWPPIKVPGKQGFFRVTIPEGNESMRDNRG